MNIYTSQQSIIQHLQGSFSAAGTPFLCKHLPETNKEYELALTVPIAYVIYSGSTAGKTVSTSPIAQPRKLLFVVECHARKLYSDAGLFVLCDVIEQCLVGFSPANCQRLSMLKDETSQGEDGAFWIRVLQFECETMLVQKEENEAIIIPSFQELIHIDNENI